MLDEQSNEKVLFSGYAKLPVGITAAEMYKVIGVIVVVDMKSGVIVKADCTLATELARRISPSAWKDITFLTGRTTCSLF